MLIPLLMLLGTAMSQPQPGPMAFAAEAHIPSTAAGAQGIAVRVLPPPRPRYAQGAPVVIVVPGGFGAEGMGGGPPLALFGFVEVHFNFPGGGQPPLRSGGANDYRGRNSARALADVILFAQGKVKTTDGKTIADLCGRVKPLPTNVGLVGLSNGGNQCVVAAGLFGSEFPDLAFYASWESPLGEGAASAECGSHQFGPNPAYDPDTGAMDYSKLAYDPDAPVRPFGRSGVPQELRGALYFDMNGNRRLDERQDFALTPVTFDLGQGAKAWYSVAVVKQAAEKKLFGNTWPAHVPTVEEATQFWLERDGALHIAQAVKNCPNLMVIVFANERDHVQAALDHPHVLAQCEGFRRAGARFIRLNPDRAYLQPLLDDPNIQVRDNPAGQAYDHISIRHALEPEAISRDPRLIAACVMELADRVERPDTSPNLNELLFPDAPNIFPRVLRRF